MLKEKLELENKEGIYLISRFNNYNIIWQYKFIGGGKLTMFKSKLAFDVV